MIKCTFCSVEYIPKRSSLGVYCSNSCQAKHTTQKVIRTWLDNPCPETFYTGNQPRRSIRTYLIQTNDCKCSRCGWGERHPSSVLPALELEHIDGDWRNCTPKNIAVICPNCHSLTDTYKARNRGSGREYRRSNPATGTTK